MLKVPTPFPQVGSFALYVDHLMPLANQRGELVRVQRYIPDLGTRGEGREDGLLIAFPLRAGATGTRTVVLADLIDATPLDKAEEREMHDIARHLSGRDRLSHKQRLAAARAEELRQRHIMSQVMAIELAKLDRLDARDTRRQGGSRGSALPAEIAA